MSRQQKINLRLLGAIVCVLVGMIILWRTFISPAPSAALPTSTSTVLPLRSTKGPQETITATATMAERSTQQTSAPAQTATPIPQTRVGITATQPATLTREAVPTVALVQASNTPRLLISATPVPQSPSALPTTRLPTAQATQLLPTQSTATAVIPATATATQAAVATVGSTPLQASATPSDTATTTSTASATATATATVETPSVTPSVSATATATTVSGNIALYQILGTTSNITIEYFDAKNRYISISGVSLPWELSFPMEEETALYITAFSKDDDSSNITCVISVNGKAKLTNTNRADAEVECDAIDQ